MEQAKQDKRGKPEYGTLGYAPKTQKKPSILDGAPLEELPPLPKLKEPELKAEPAQDQMVEVCPCGRHDCLKGPRRMIPRAEAEANAEAMDFIAGLLGLDIGPHHPR